MSKITNLSMTLQDVIGGLDSSRPTPQGNVALSRPVLSGHRIGLTTPTGMRVGIEVSETQTPFATQTLRPQNVVLVLMLSGRVEALVGETPLVFEPARSGAAQLTLSALMQPMPFHRKMAQGTRLRKMVISIPWDWFAARGLEDTLQDPSGQKHAVWTLPASLTAEAERIIDADVRGEPFAQLRAEAFAMSIVAFAMDALGAAPQSQLSDGDQARLAQLERMARASGALPSQDDMARAVGLSKSSLKRMIQRVCGTSLGQYLRDLKLDCAEEALRQGRTVAQAAHIAGYATPEGFATAYRRVKGHAPSHFQRDKEQAPRLRGSG